MKASDRLDEIVKDGYDSVADYRGISHRAAAFIDGLEVRDKLTYIIFVLFDKHLHGIEVI